MTDEEIDALSGAELDVLIHQRVFGKRVEKRRAFMGTFNTGKEVYREYYFDPDDKTQYLHFTDGYAGMIPNYSANFQDAWLVVSHLSKNGYWFNLSYNGEEVAIDIDRLEGKLWVRAVEEYTGSSVPEAICRASLRAVNHD
jgi:hypothetical protein